ncbi:MAG TPA: hypothetical protein GX506_03100 [Firmicutes bacterium]|nr:hypothetical protein [Bacillota bacterium]
MKRRILLSLIGLASLMFLLLAGAEASGPGTSQSSDGSSLSIIVGRSMLLNFDGLVRAAVGNPAVADVAVISGKELLVNAKSPGETTLHVWDRGGVKTYLIKVDRNEAEIARIVKELIAIPDVSVKAAGGIIILEGNVARPEDKLRAEVIAKTYSDKVLNLVSVSPDEHPKPANVVIEVIRGTEKSTVSLPGLDERG